MGKVGTAHLTLALEGARCELPELIESLQPGEEVQIFSGDRTVARKLADFKAFKTSVISLAYRDFILF